MFTVSEDEMGLWISRTVAWLKNSQHYFSTQEDDEYINTQHVIKQGDAAQQDPPVHRSSSFMELSCSAQQFCTGQTPCHCKHCETSSKTEITITGEV